MSKNTSVLQVTDPVLRCKKA